MREGRGGVPRAFVLQQASSEADPEIARGNSAHSPGPKSLATYINYEADNTTKLKEIIDALLGPVGELQPNHRLPIAADAAVDDCEVDVGDDETGAPSPCSGCRR